MELKVDSRVKQAKLAAESRGIASLEIQETLTTLLLILKTYHDPLAKLKIFATAIKIDPGYTETPMQASKIAQRIKWQLVHTDSVHLTQIIICGETLAKLDSKEAMVM